MPKFSAPVEVGDWTFQVIDVERLDSYYAEHYAQVFEPEGVFTAQVVVPAQRYDADKLVAFHSRLSPRTIHFRFPGGFELELYQPHYQRGG